ncbi:hypothetical protein ACFL2O_04390 [Thermodesulfobacteriota bacterium]
MLETGIKIEMTKGYRGIKGAIVDRTESEYEFYTILLNNGIRLVAGPSAFLVFND